MIRIYALDTTRHIGTITVSNGQSTEEQYLNYLILLQLAPCSPRPILLMKFSECHTYTCIMLKSIGARTEP